ncbi:restriction endonuclease, partial [Citrobacter sp. AAK_AS5]
TTGWGKALQDFIGAKGKLAERYEKRKTALSLTVEVAKAVDIIFSPGKHNELQIKIISEWRPRFCPSAEVVYVGDTAHKFLH